MVCGSLMPEQLERRPGRGLVARCITGFSTAPDEILANRTSARAVQTAELAFGGRGILIRLDARLRECDYGERNGMPVTRLAAERSWHIDQPWPGGQSHRQVVAQVGSFLQDLSAGWEGRAVVVIGHSATKWALDCLPDGATLENLVDAPFGWQEGWHYRLPTDWRSQGHR